MKLQRIRGLGALSALLVALSVSAPASAAFITTRAGLGANDFIDWAQLGAPGSAVPDPANVTSDGGLAAVLDNPSGQIERRNQGIDWAGNFAPNDALVWSRHTPGPLSIAFATGVAGAGAQIQPNLYGTFTAIIRAFGAGNVLLESYTLGGNSTAGGNNSAIFLGILRATADILRLEFDIVPNGRDFAINRVSLVTQGTRVPEPGSLALFGLALVGVAALRRKSRS